MILTIFFISFALNFILSSNAVSQTYVVHMDRNKMETLGASLGISRSWHEQVIESISISSSDDDEQTHSELHYVYDNVICGFSAKLTNQQLKALESVDGFLWATEDELHPLHTTHSPQFLGLEKGEGLWSPGNLSSDVIIGMLDTGIWPEHSSFHDKGLSAVPSRWKGKCQNYPSFNASSCNKKLIGAAVFFKGYEQMFERRIDDKTEYRSPRDNAGHGTHTASTAGGNFVSNDNISCIAKGTAAGMRPTARIAAYKACFELGCADSDLLAAIEQAVKDGVDVLSISVGGSPGPYIDDSLAIGTFGAVQKGVIVSLSAGNSGPDSYTVGNVAPWMMTVAASSTDRDFVAQVHLGNGRSFSGTSLSLHKTITNILVYNQTIGPNLCLNGTLSHKVVNAKIVICDRGGNSSRVSKGEEVKRAGGAAMILANVGENGEEVLADLHVLPTVALGASAAYAVKNYVISSRNLAATIKFKGTLFKRRAPAMATFSSRGPSMVDPWILKPDITAPGLNILAAYPPNISPTNLDSDTKCAWVNMKSGTSMSCPHVSGIMALLKSVHRDWSPAAIKSALMTTAYVIDSHNYPISDMSGMHPATPFVFGSGHVDVNKASHPGLIYDISTQDYLNYLCSLKNMTSKHIQLFSGSNTTCDAHFRFRPGDLNYPSFSVVLDRTITKNRSKATYKRTVTNVGSSTTYHVNVSEPEGVSITVKPKVLEFSKMRQTRSYYVSFKAKGIMSKTSKFSFGYLKWISGDEYSVRSPIALIWN